MTTPTREQVIQWARDAGGTMAFGMSSPPVLMEVLFRRESLVTFAALAYAAGQAAEREACAKECEDGDYFGVGKHKAARIRARGAA